MLESHGIRCWVAPRDILPSQDWASSIIDAINGARAMVLVFSANANASTQIKREVERAVNKGIPVIPLRIENIEPTATLEFFISSHHWLDAFTPPLERHLRYLAEVTRKIIGGPEVSTSPPLPETESRKDEAVATEVAEEGPRATEAAKATRIAEELSKTKEEAGRLGLGPRVSTEAQPAASSPPALMECGVGSDREGEFVRSKSKAPVIATVAALLAILAVVAVWRWVPPEEKGQARQDEKQLQPPAETPKREDARGAVLIQTEPSGAIVILGEESRKSPATFNRLKVGSWPIKVERDGYEPVEQSVFVEENTVGKVPVIKLVRSTGRVQINSQPTGMKFELVDADGEHHSGKTPAELENIAIGTGSIVFTAESGPEHWQPIKIARNQTVTASWRTETISRPAPSLEAATIAPPNVAVSETNFRNSLGRTMVWIPNLRIWVSETETTQGEFASVTGHNPSRNSRSDELPVDRVTVSEVVDFCVRLTKKEASKLAPGYAYGLPTDSQWSVFCGNASLQDAITSKGTKRSGPARVKSLGANEFGLYDIRGNVWEWTRTPYSDSLNSSDVRWEFRKGLDSHGQVLRGGSWQSDGTKLLIDTRGSNRPSMRDTTNGFRVVLAPRE